MKCPNCGAEIGNDRTCQYCGSSATVEMIKEQEVLNKSGCPRCKSTNVTFTREKQGEVKTKKGTSVVRSTVGVCKDCGFTWNATPKAKSKAPIWLWVLGWLFIFPLPLTILLLRKKNTMNKYLLYGLIALAWIIYLIIGFSGKSDKTTTDDSTITSDTAVVTEMETESTTEATTQASETVSDNVIVIEPNQEGEYGTTVVFNAGTDFEDTEIQYHLPAGTYLVTNLGPYPGQLGIYQDGVEIDENGWEVVVSEGSEVYVLNYDDTLNSGEETLEITIRDGYYIDLNVNSNVSFTPVG